MIDYEEDQELEGRRYVRFMELTKGKKPGEWDFEEVLALLPRDGGRKCRCGHTRLDHILDGPRRGCSQT